MDASSAAEATLQDIFLHGPLLDAVQRSGIFQDSKHFVDMPLLRDPPEILEAFRRLPSPASGEALEALVRANFGEPGSDLEAWLPEDYPEEPPAELMRRIACPRYQEWARALHGLWLELGRRTAPQVAAAPERHSLLHRRHGLIVPGGRFRETYYWDSFWIVQGLLASGMVATAEGVVRNLLDDVARFGFVPNGGRAYYLDRSQPPFLAAMVEEVFEASGDAAFLADALPLLRREMNFWGAGDACLEVTTADGATVMLHRYASRLSTPRPESYREDVATAALASGGAEGARVCAELRAAAASGWDFSTRWMRGHGDGADAERSECAASLAQTATTSVVPADLNAILYRAHRTIARLCRRLPEARRDEDAARHHEAEAARLLSGMRSAMADGRTGRILDLWLQPEDGAGRGAPRHRARCLGVETAATAAVAWAGVYDDAPDAVKDGVVDVLGNCSGSPLAAEGGLATTRFRSGQQWDAPNGWPPLQQMAVEGLSRIAAAAPPSEDGGVGRRAAEAAAGLASRWLAASYRSWVRAGAMVEKMDALQPGVSGGGGEYDVQVGFGWSNGVVLRLLRDFGSRCAAPEADAEA